MRAAGAGVPAVSLRAEVRPADLRRPVPHPKPGAHSRLSLRKNQSLEPWSVERPGGRLVELEKRAYPPLGWLAQRFGSRLWSCMAFGMLMRGLLRV